MRNHAPLGLAGLALSLLVILGGAPRAHAQNRSGGDGWLGILSQSLTPELREGLDYRGEGVVVNHVEDDSPAYRAGIKKRDVIVSVNQRTVKSPDDLARVIRAGSPGQELSIRIVRNGEPRTLTARLSSRPVEGGGHDEVARPQEKVKLEDLDDVEDIPDLSIVIPKRDEIRRMVRDGKKFHMRIAPGRARLGVRVEDLSEGLGDYFSGDSGALVVEVIEGTPAERAGIKAGDVITRVGGKRVADSGDLIESLRGKNGTVEIELRRRGATRTVNAELKSSEPRAFKIRDLQGFEWNDDHDDHGDQHRLRMFHDGSDDELRRELSELSRELAELRRELAEMERKK